MQTPAENKLISKLTALIRARHVIISGCVLYRLLASIQWARERGRGRERENSLPRDCFVTLGTVLDGPELVLLSGEKSLLPCQSSRGCVPHTFTSVQPAAGRTEARRRGGEGEGRGRRKVCEEEKCRCHGRRRAAATAAPAC